MGDTPVDLDALEKLLAEATHPRWIAGEVRPDGTTQVYSPNLGPCRVIVPIAETTGQDAVLIAALRNAAPALLREVRRLREEEAQRQDIVCALNDGCVRYEKEITTLRAGLKEACDGWESQLEARKGRVGWVQEQAPPRATIARLRALLGER